MKKITVFSFLVCLFFGIVLIDSCKKEHVIPTLTTAAFTNITINSVTSGGIITASGGDDVTDRGVCWNTDGKPAIDGSHTTDGTGSGSFISNITDLTPNTMYYVRAFATNRVGTAYGDEVPFTTTPIVIPTLTTTEATSITLSTAVSGGNITADGGGAVTAKGTCWATTANPTISNSLTTVGTGSGSFISNLTGLAAGTTYHIRAYATNSAGTAYGNDLSFITGMIVVPTLTTTAVTSITLTTAISGGTVSADGGSAIIARGVCWATTANPTITNSKTSDATGTGSFISNLSALVPGTIYHVRAYATNISGTAYGNDIPFTATPIAVPTLTTTAVTSVTLTSAVSGGNIIADNGGAILARGICWATSTNPTITNNKTTSGTGTGGFASNLTGLLPATTYYVRAYATNNAGTAYGNEVSFTSGQLAVPTLTTTNVASITYTTASSGGNIAADGGTAVTAKGTCWSTTVNPTIANSLTSDGTGTGIFTSNMTGLTPGTIYHVRAYAINNVGTAYGNDVIFTTNPILVPTLTTVAVTSITYTTSVSGGNISSDGGGTISAKGVCWATTANPTITSSNTTDGTGIVSFVSNLTALTPGTFYHVRAYATNSAGIAYGNDVTFTSNPIVVPTVTTTSVTSITTTSAISGGNVTDNGGGVISARGVCWATTTAPSIANIITTDGTGTGSFSSSLTGLSAGNTYYVRAYATNSAGTIYGNEFSFNTKIADNEGNIYNTIKIGTQAWMAENLKATKFNDGTLILTTTLDISAEAAPIYQWVYGDLATYGRLYTWYAVDAASNGNKNVCPTGWHVPTEVEWETLRTNLGGGAVAGGKLKETGITHWQTPNTGATNESGFTALPGGYRQSTGGFVSLQATGWFWSSTIDGANAAQGLGYGMRWDDIVTLRYGFTKPVGASVRCLRDF